MNHVSEQEAEDPLDRWRREKAEREEPQPRERKLDILPPTLAEIDQRIGERIAAEHELMIDIIGEVVAQLQSDPEMRGPPAWRGRGASKARPASCRSSSCWNPMWFITRATS